MTPRPGFICVMVNDMARSLTFYRHLGFKFPLEAYGEIHVELELPGGLQIYWQVAQFAKLYAPDYRPAPHGMVTLGFQVDSAREVDALFTKLKRLGYKADRTPWEAPWGTRYANVYDPTATSSRSTTLSLEIQDAPGEGAHGDAGAGGGVVRPAARTASRVWASRRLVP
jgi:catechol 2,3-dioxygenase-like lactoylglutathione lyase family enzyme